MTVFQICRPRSHERAESGLRRAVDAEGGRTLNARDRPVEDDWIRHHSLEEGLFVL
jgi:hypothetical protein